MDDWMRGRKALGICASCAAIPSTCGTAGLFGGFGTVGVDSKKDLKFREGRPRAKNHAITLERYARRSRTCARGDKYAMSEGRKILEVTICILGSVSIKHF
jgi:hypothetical protein